MSEETEAEAGALDFLQHPYVRSAGVVFATMGKIYRMAQKDLRKKRAKSRTPKGPMDEVLEQVGLDNPTLEAILAKTLGDTPEARAKAAAIMSSGDAAKLFQDFVNNWTEAGERTPSPPPGSARPAPPSCAEGSPSAQAHEAPPGPGPAPAAPPPGPTTTATPPTPGDVVIPPELLQATARAAQRAAAFEAGAAGHEHAGAQTRGGVVIPPELLDVTTRAAQRAAAATVGHGHAGAPQTPTLEELFGCWPPPPPAPPPIRPASRIMPSRRGWIDFDELPTRPRPAAAPKARATGGATSKARPARPAQEAAAEVSQEEIRSFITWTKDKLTAIEHRMDAQERRMMKALGRLEQLERAYAALKAESEAEAAAKAAATSVATVAATAESTEAKAAAAMIEVEATKAEAAGVESEAEASKPEASETQAGDEIEVEAEAREPEVVSEVPEVEVTIADTEAPEVEVTIDVEAREPVEASEPVEDDKAEEEIETENADPIDTEADETEETIEAESALPSTAAEVTACTTALVTRMEERVGMFEVVGDHVMERVSFLEEQIAQELAERRARRAREEETSCPM